LLADMEATAKSIAKTGRSARAADSTSAEQPE